MLDVEALYVSEHDRMRRYFARRIGDRDPSLADDLAADVFLRAWAKRHLYQPRPNVPPAAWLAAVARNVLADYFRSERATASLDVRVALGLEPLIPERSATIEWVTMLSAALSTLTPMQRAVIVGRFYEGRKHRELSEISTYDGSKKLQDRALVNLRRALGAA